MQWIRFVGDALRVGLIDWDRVLDDAFFAFALELDSMSILEYLEDEGWADPL